MTVRGVVSGFHGPTAAQWLGLGPPSAKRSRQFSTAANGNWSQSSPRRSAAGIPIVTGPSSPALLRYAASIGRGWLCLASIAWAGMPRSCSDWHDGNRLCCCVQPPHKSTDNRRVGTGYRGRAQCDQPANQTGSRGAAGSRSAAWEQQKILRAFRDSCSSSSNTSCVRLQFITA